MKTVDEIKKDRQVRLVMDKVARYGGKIQFEITEKEVALVVKSGAPEVQVFIRDGKGWAPKAAIQGNGSDTVRFAWEPSYFDGPYVPPTKPADSLPDADVLKMIPKMQIDTKALLVSICNDLRQGIEAAYPGVALSEAGFGQAKKELLFTVIRTLFGEGKISRNVEDCHVLVLKNLIYHFQISLGATMKLDGVSPVVTQTPPAQ